MPLFQGKTYNPAESLGVSPTVQGVQLYAGSGAPTFSAVKGSIYVNTAGSTTNDRAYINTDGATTWTAFTTAA